MHSDTKFIRCRASAIGFATTSNSSSSNSRTSRTRRPPRSGFLSTVDEDDPYDEKADYDEDGEERDDDDDVDVDTDMLPTMLIYRAGQLIHNWVRVDWEAGKAGVEDLLQR